MEGTEGEPFKSNITSTLTTFTWCLGELANLGGKWSSLPQIVSYVN